MYHNHPLSDKSTHQTFFLCNSVQGLAKKSNLDISHCWAQHVDSCPAAEKTGPASFVHAVRHKKVRSEQPRASLTTESPKHVANIRRTVPSHQLKNHKSEFKNGRTEGKYCTVTRKPGSINKGSQLMTEFHPCTDSQDVSSTPDACVSQHFLSQGFHQTLRQRTNHSFRVNSRLFSEAPLTVATVPKFFTGQIDRLHA